MKIPQLEDLPLWKRIVLGIVIIAVVMLALALSWDVGSAPQHPPRIVSPYDQRLLELDKQAVEHAYILQVEKLTANWFNDSAGQPGRMLVGLRNAQHVYIDAITEIEKYQSSK